jgi:hypothetical protein
VAGAWVQPQQKLHSPGTVAQLTLQLQIDSYVALRIHSLQLIHMLCMHKLGLSRYGGKGHTNATIAR